jgi:hypothetical protein
LVFRSIWRREGGWHGRRRIQRHITHFIFKRQGRWWRRRIWRPKLGGKDLLKRIDQVVSSEDITIVNITLMSIWGWGLSIRLMVILIMNKPIQRGTLNNTSMTTSTSTASAPMATATTARQHIILNIHSQCWTWGNQLEFDALHDVLVSLL